MILNDPDVYTIGISYNDAVLGADSPYPLSPSASSTPFPLYFHRVLGQGKAAIFWGIGK